MPSYDASVVEWGLFKEIQKIGSNVSSTMYKYENLKGRVEQSIINNKTMTAVLTKVPSSITKCIQENKMIKEENSILKEQFTLPNKPVI